MKVKSLLDQFDPSPSSMKIAMLGVATAWTVVLAALIVGVALFLERPGQAQQPTPGVGTPTLILEPTVGPPGTVVTVHGQGWRPGQWVLIYLAAPGQSEPPGYATDGSTASAMGSFVTRLVIPAGSEWRNQGLARVIAHTGEGGASAQAFFSVRGALSPQP